MDQLHQDTITELRKHIGDASILTLRCPLDHGKHDATPHDDATLGSLCALPTELRHLVFSFLDIRSLLVFRRVSKLAMSLVNAMTEYHKVVTNTPDALRMAIAIRVHHQYTISELFDALCTRKCADCGTLTQYLDVFRLRRVCLSLNGFCQGLRPSVQVSAEHRRFRILRPIMEQIYGNVDAALDRLPTFTPIPGRYSAERRFGHGGVGFHDNLTTSFLCFDPNGVPQFEAALSVHTATTFRTTAELNGIMRKSMSLVIAPWLDSKNMGSASGVQCSICAHTYDIKRKSCQARTDTKEGWEEIMNLKICELWPEEGLAEHMRDAHGAEL